MRILFLAPDYVGLQQPIIDEMIRQGNEVVWIEDESIPYDMRVPNRSILNRFRCIVNNLFFLPSRHHWQKIFLEHTDDLSRPFDLFFCINGRSLCKEFFCWINTMKGILKVQYVWDTAKVFDFYKYKEQFDKVFSFDKYDASNIPGVIYLPFYWVPNDKIEEIKYDISLIGTDHDGRFEFVNKLLPQIKVANLSYFLKIQVFKPDFNHIAFYRIRYLLSEKLRQQISKAERENEVKMDSEISMTEPISPHEYISIIKQSACILDTDRETQTGITPRAIWALAYGKKIITTNKNLLSEPFYSAEQIQVIDRNSPQIDSAFIRSNNNAVYHPYFDQLRIDMWIGRIINR